MREGHGVAVPAVKESVLGVGAADEVQRFVKVVDEDVDHRRLRAAEPVGAPQPRRSPGAASRCRHRRPPGGTWRCRATRRRLRAQRDRSALSTPGPPSRSASSVRACSAIGASSAPTTGLKSSASSRSSQKVVTFTGRTRSRSGSAATISSVSPGGNTLLRALASQSKVNRPGLSWLSGTMPIWLSTVARTRFRFGCTCGEAAAEDAGQVGRRVEHVEEAGGLLAVPIRPDQQQLASRRARSRAELVRDGGEEVDDLDRPVVALGHVGRSLDHHGVVGEVRESHAVDRVIVRGDHLALRRRHVVVQVTHAVLRGAREKPHRCARLLHQLPGAGTPEGVDGGISPVVHDPCE